MGGGADMGGAAAAEPAAPEAPLSESTKKRNILSMLAENDNMNDLFDVNKAQQNIYEIENKLKDILNEQ